jgi:hypothetical protein
MLAYKQPSGSDATGDDDTVYANMAVTALPHRDPNRHGGGAIWRQTRDGILYEFSSGCYGDGKLIGIPFGSKARMILLSCLTWALRHKSQVVPMGDSSYVWIREMNGQSIGGKTYKVMSDQALRIDACSIRVSSIDLHSKMKDEYSSEHALISAANSVLLEAIKEDRRVLDPDPLHYRCKRFAGSLPDSVLGKGFYESYGTPPIAISRTAVRQIAHNCTAIDLYIWLSARLPGLTEQTFVSWTELSEVFGCGFKHLKHLRSALAGTLEQIRVIYPESRVDVLAEGWMLHQSPAPVAHQDTPLMTEVS